MTGIPAVFLDRDGIINRAIVRDRRPYPPTTLDEVEIIPGVVNSLQRLDAHGYLLIGISNQPDVARGRESRESVEAINAFLLSQLPVREILVCYHDDADGCECRKPKPGLILQAAMKYNLELQSSWMVGDRWKDIAAGKAAGVKTVFVDYHYSEKYKCNPADIIIDDVSLLADVILNNHNENT